MSKTLDKLTEEEVSVLRIIYHDATGKYVWDNSWSVPPDVTVTDKEIGGISSDGNTET